MLIRALEDLGAGTLRFLAYAGAVASLSAESVEFITRMNVRVAETVNQAYILGFQSFAIVVLTALFTGMVISLESAQQAVVYGLANMVGGVVAFGAARELGPMLTGVVVAGRAGAAIAAELGSMVVTEQIEALEALGLSPVRMLVVPRLLALMIMLPVLTIFGDVISIVGGMWVANTVAHIGYVEFIDSMRQRVVLDDFLKGLLKSIVFGLIIALIGAYQGLRTRGGAVGVGRSTTAAVVTAIILIFVTNFLMSYVLFGSS
jgi:phospholipid/cholesterol/gamma-HCH transport system permease protein